MGTAARQITPRRGGWGGAHPPRTAGSGEQRSHITRSSPNQQTNLSSFRDLKSILFWAVNVLDWADAALPSRGEGAGGGVITRAHHLIRREHDSERREDGPHGTEDDVFMSPPGSEPWTPAA